MSENVGMMPINLSLGARHSPTPSTVPLLASLAATGDLIAKPEIDHYTRIDLTGSDGRPNALGNLDYGDCVPVSALRECQIKRSFVWHDEWKPTKALALTYYQKWGGFPDIDLGCDTAQANAQWQREGILLQQTEDGLSDVRDVPLWLSLDPRDANEMRLAIEWFVSIGLTMRLPRSIEAMPEVWDEPEPGSSEAADWGLHRVPCGRYTPNGLEVISWGRIVRVTPEFADKRIVAADAMLSRLALDHTSKTPYGDTWTQLLRRRDWIITH